METTRDFSGLSVVISVKAGAVLNRCPGVVGLNFLTAMFELFINRLSQIDNQVKHIS
jgi:hypothetical protein